MVRVVKLTVMMILVATVLFLGGCIIETPTPRPTAIPAGAEAATPLPTAAGVITPTPKLLRQGGRTIKQFGQPPLFTIDTSAQYTATVRTNNGPFTLELFASQAPVTVNNFVFLARDGFYNGVSFHRVIEGFMIQGGDPTGTGAGNPGYNFEDEILPSLVFDQAGVLAMANSGPNTNGSQFFITVAPTPSLNGGYTIFGRLVAGQDIINTISTVATDARDRPLDPVIIRNIVITKSGGS